MKYVLVYGNRQYTFNSLIELNERVKQIEEILKSMDLIGKDTFLEARKIK